MTEERFIDLVRIEQVPLRRFLLALCSGDSATADDIAQDSLVRAYVASGSFKGLSSFRTWLFRIAYNCYIDHCRKTQPQRLPIDGREALNKTADDDPDHLFRFKTFIKPLTGCRRKRKRPSSCSTSKTAASRRLRLSLEFLPERSSIISHLGDPILKN